MAQSFFEKKITAISRLGIWEHYKKTITDETLYLLAQKGNHVGKSEELAGFEVNLKMDL